MHRRRTSGIEARLATAMRALRVIAASSIILGLSLNAQGQDNAVARTRTASSSLGPRTPGSRTAAGPNWGESVPEPAEGGVFPNSAPARRRPADCDGARGVSHPCVDTFLCLDARSAAVPALSRLPICPALAGAIAASADSWRNLSRTLLAPRLGMRFPPRAQRVSRNRIDGCCISRLVVLESGGFHWAPVCRKDLHEFMGPVPTPANNL